MTAQKPLVLACSLPLSGHALPMISVANALSEEGYDVTFVTGTAFKDKVETAGAEFVPLVGKANYNDHTLDDIVPGRKDMAPTFNRTVVDVEYCMVDTIVEQYESLQVAFAKLSEKGRPVVLLSDVCFFGAHLVSLGAPGFKPAGWICVGMLPLLIRSKHLLGPESDSSPEALVKKQQMNYALEHMVFAKSVAKQKEYCKQLGALEEPGFIWEHGYLKADRFLQLCPPSLEFHREDLPSTVRFVGAVPPHKHSAFEPPVWWNDVLSAKKVVLVTQGTFAIDYTHLIIPTMEALKDEKDTLVVAILGRHGAKLPESTVVPANARVIDYLYYDKILPHSNVMVYNGGYGGLQHSLAHSVPVVIAGDSEDKPMVAQRAEHAGVAIDLKTGTPTTEQIKDAVERVLGDEIYFESSRKVQRELEALDSAKLFDETIMEIANRDFGYTTKSDSESEEIPVAAVETQVPSS